MLGGLFPESIFGRKLNPNAERRLRLSQARAEETMIRAHVDNALMFVDTLAEDLSFDRAIDTYAIGEIFSEESVARGMPQLGACVAGYCDNRKKREPLVAMTVT
jgi:hypothetical protein